MIFLYTSNQQSENEINTTNSHKSIRKNKTLKKNLTKEIQELYKEDNLENGRK